MGKEHIKAFEFKPGNKMGKGRPKVEKLTEAEREKLRNMSAEIQKNLVEATYDLLGADVLNIQDIRNNKKENALKGLLSSVLMKAFNKGDIKSIDTILNRVIGPVKQRVDITTNDESIKGTKDESIAKMKSDILDVMQAEKEWESQTSSEPLLPPSEVS